MNRRENILDCYGKTASVYAQKYFGELEQKHFDRMILTQFAREQRPSEMMIDLGCGPGQTTAFLESLGVKNILGTDLSEEMIAEAKRLSPHISFETADILDLRYNENQFGSAIAFYAIIHFDYQLLEEAFRSVKGILKPGGQFLLSFHLGNEVIHMDNFLDSEVNINFRFFEMHQVIKIAKANGFDVIDAIKREPYPEIEYQSKRAYLWLRALTEV